MEISLAQLPPGKEGSLVQLEGNSPLTRRLRTLGLVPGTRVECLYRCPGGSVTALGFRGAVFALRTKDLKRIGVWC